MRLPRFRYLWGWIAGLVSRRPYLWGGIAGLVLLLAAGGWFYAASRVLVFPDAEYVIQPGTSLKQLADDLAAREAYPHPQLLRLAGRWSGAHRRLRAGTYRFPERLSMSEFLDAMVDGRYHVGRRLTLIEGWTFAEMRANIERHPDLRRSLDGIDGRELMALLERPDQSPEGRFFPDTYQFPPGDLDLDIYRRALARMETELMEAWAARDRDIPLANPTEALILASIIEKESWHGGERRKIGGVFHNRLRRGMRLQSDVTVAYGQIGKPGYRGEVRQRHLRADTPHNTYTRAGLPPTPICMPSRESLWAAVRPESTDALYFVATGKGDGLHHFSATLAEHNRRVREYRSRIR